MDKDHEDKLAEDNRMKGSETELEFLILNVLTPTCITDIHFSLQKLGMTTEKDDKVLDLSSLTFD